MVRRAVLIIVSLVFMTLAALIAPAAAQEPVVKQEAILISTGEIWEIECPAVDLKLPPPRRRLTTSINPTTPRFSLVRGEAAAADSDATEDVNVAPFDPRFGSQSTRPTGHPPVGSTHVSPRAVGYQNPEPVYLASPPFLERPRRAQAAEPTVEVAGRDAYRPGATTGQRNGTPPSESPPSDEPLPPQGPAMTTSLPLDYTVPMFVPVGPSTGHATWFSPQSIEAPPEIVLGSPPSLAARSVLYPDSGIGAVPPEQRFGLSGLGLLYYERHIGGGYGETDVSARQQIYAFIIGVEQGLIQPPPQ